MGELQWLRNKYHDDNITDDSVSHILHFGLIWNVFENDCCQNEAHINTHSPGISQEVHEVINEDVLNRVWNFFHHRYVENNRMTPSFQSFVFYNGGKDFVQRILLRGDEATRQEKTEALLRIIFRLRNNLYHGEKEIVSLPGQNESFRWANVFLMEIIDKVGN